MGALKFGSIFKTSVATTVLLFISYSYGRILRLQCRGVADFSLEAKGHLLKGTVIAEYEEVGLYECYEHCYYNKRCKSINIESEDYGRCQLNNASSYDVMDRVNLTQDANWNFRSTNFSDRLLGSNCKEKKPCRQDQLCMDTCECPGFECVDCVNNKRGVHCNRCASNPCQNGGTCVETQESFCKCPSGFQGVFCEKVLDKCFGSPCDANADCVNTTGSFSCTCRNGYTGNGTSCTDLNECLRNPCDANADCANTVGSFRCTCRNGYTGNGTSCAYVDPCSSNPCTGNGSCVSFGTSYNCTCTPGYYGSSCTTQYAWQTNCDFSSKTGKTDLATKEICVNHCKNDGYNGASVEVPMHDDHYHCHCATDTVTEADSKFECITSIQDFDNCFSSPCNNSGSCTSISTGYECTCTGQYVGATCDKRWYSDCSYGDLSTVTGRGITTMRSCYEFCKSQSKKTATLHTTSFLCYCSDDTVQQATSGMHCMVVS